MRKSGFFKLKRAVAGIMIFVMLVTSALIFAPGDVPVAYAATFGGGDGTASNPYQISNASQLSQVVLDDAGQGIFYVLTSDITTSASQTTPVINGNFLGNLDGNGHKLTIYQPLMLNLSTPGVIRNVVFDVNIAGNLATYGVGDSKNRHLGAVACSSSGTIDNCSGKIVINVNGTGVQTCFVGGLFGGNVYPVIRNCCFTDCSIQFNSTNSVYGSYVGGFLGQVGGMTIENSIFVGEVFGSMPNGQRICIGSLAADLLWEKMTVKNCYAYNTHVAASNGGQYGAFGILIYGNQTTYDFSNNYYRSARDPEGEPQIGGVADMFNDAQIKRVTADPEPLYTENNATYRKWATGTSFESYESSMVFGRSTITLDANGGRVYPSAVKKLIGRTVTLPTPERAGYSFAGWAADPADETATFKANDLYYGNDGIKLYALWKENPAEDVNYGTEDLSNKDNDISAKMHRMDPQNADSKTNLANLKIHITSLEDEVLIYKVADLEYDSAATQFYRPAWNDEVKNWIEANNLSYTSPAILANAAAYEQKSFYTNMFIGDEMSVVTEEPYSLAPYIPKEYEDANAEDILPFVYTGEVDAIEPCIDISGFEAGQYVIVASSGSRKFTPFVVNIVPERYGADGGYYLYDWYEIYLKAAGANVTKYIVDGKCDTDVAEGEDDPSDVHMAAAGVGDIRQMRIAIDMPNYADRITYGYNAVPYTMVLSDIMDDSMYIVNETGEYAGNPVDDLKFYYKNPGTDTYELLPDTEVTYIEFTDGSVAWGESLPVTEEQSTTLQDCYYYEMTGLLYWIERVNTYYNSDKDRFEGGFKVYFNMPAMKSWAKQNGMTFIPKIEVRYNVLAATGIRVGSELNTNTASIQYEISSDGLELTTQEDTVNLYAYGLAIHKLDGDTNQALADASFYLYKRIGEFVEDKENGGQKFELTAPGFKMMMAPGIETLDDFRNDSNYYVYEYQDEISGKEITAIFIKLDYFGSIGSVTTTVDGEGKNDLGERIPGLGEGQYILEEYMAPIGYNKLSEDMLIEIKGFTEAEALEKGITLASYKSDDGEALPSGYYDLKVLNYKGLTLPSTGGAGTILFTMTGLVIMTVVVVVVTGRRRRGKYMDELEM